MSLIDRFRQLPGQTKALLAAGGVLGLLVALPLFVFAVLNVNFELREKAAGGEPTPTAIPTQITDWETAYAKFWATNFYIEVNGQRFSGSPIINIGSDPGSPTYTTLEVTWHENGVEMRLFLYFNADDQQWWLREARIYNGQNPADWVTLLSNTQAYKTNLGSAFSENTPGGLSLINSQTGQPSAQVHWDSLNLQGFVNYNEPCQRSSVGIVYFEPQNPVANAGQKVTYTLEIANSDRGKCPESNFNLGATPPNNQWSVNLSTSNFLLGPGERGFMTMDVTSPVNAQPNTTEHITVSLSEANVAAHSNLFAIPYSISPSASLPPSPSVPPVYSTCENTDINKDGITDLTDYSILANDFFKTSPSNPRSNINGDGIVDITDYSLLVANFFKQTGSCQ